MGMGVGGIEAGAARVARAVALLSQKLDLPGYEERSFMCAYVFGWVGSLFCEWVGG